jgi:hypothetical protein
MIEWLDMVLSSGRFYGGWILAMAAGVPFLALAAWLDDCYDTDWAILPGFIGSILLFGYTAAIPLFVLARIAGYVFTGR